MPTGLQQFAADDFCYLTTIGRVSGQPHTIEIWFALDRRTLFMLSGSHSSDWVKNLLRAPDVVVRLGEMTLAGHARVVEQADEDALARRLVVGTYQPRSSDDLAGWGCTALPVAVDFSRLNSVRPPGA
ncbi:MAG: nitroreductase family deazaflavin-dependent oxidoreductase [Chloroflexota bacterium]|nr:nitroreductase family deazaflavin-dependent oxidoreductase [Chloroflexota bacterium]